MAAMPDLVRLVPTASITEAVALLDVRSAITAGDLVAHRITHPTPDNMEQS